MIRRFLPLFVFCASVLSLHGAESTDLVLNADKTEIDVTTNETVLSGHVDAREADMLVTADQLRYRKETGGEELTITGHVVYTRSRMRILADRIVINRRTGSFAAEHVRLGSYPYFIEGQSASGTREDITVTNARVAYGEPGPWQPTISATKVYVSAGHRVRFEGAQAGIGHVRPLPFPSIEQSVSEPLLAFVTVSGGYRSSLGAFVDGGIHIPVAPGVRLGGDVGYYTGRGLLVGPSGTYTNASDPDQLRGVFRSGYINDHGDKKTDVLGRPVPEERAFVEWQHQQTLNEATSLTAQFNWWRDSEVVRDFRPRQFIPVQQPDSFVEATYAGANSFASAFARFAPNDFETVQQRVPEIRFDLLPTAVGGGFVERFNGSVAMLHEESLPVIPATADLRSTRIDAYYGLMRPIKEGDWLAVTPVAGGRFTHYMNTRGAARTERYTRVLGEIGADAELRASGTFAYKNEAWKIDGLRHLFTPRLSYRYIPEADKGRAYIPAIDRETFSTYLQPIGLGDVRNIDDLHATNVLRLSLDNALQTRDPEYGARDLLTFNVANDFRFKRRLGERDVSEIHTELAAMPTRWLEFGFYNSFAPQTSTLREFNAGITIRDGNVWSVRFANNFLRHELEDYFIDARRRLNEQFDALARLRYDQRKHRFNEQAYGIVQNLANTWRISYVVSLYSGPRRESHFGFSVQIDTVRF